MPKLLDATISGAVNRVTDPLSIGKTPLYVAAQAKYVAGAVGTASYTIGTDTPVVTPSAVRITVTDVTPGITTGTVRVKGTGNVSGVVEYEDLDISGGAGEYDTTTVWDDVTAAAGGVFSWGVGTLGGASDELIRAEWFKFPYTGTQYTIINPTHAADTIDVIIADDGGSIIAGEVRIQGIVGGVEDFENVDISVGVGTYTTTKAFTSVSAVASVGVSAIAGPVVSTGGQIAYLDGTPPTATKIVTIPDGGGTDYVYTFVVAADSTGGNVSYADGTAPTVGQTVTIPGLGAFAGVYTFVPDVIATGGNFSYTDGTLPVAGQTVTMPDENGTPVVYTFVATVAVNYDIKIGASADASFANLTTAINYNEAEGVGDNAADGLYMAPSAHSLYSAVHTAGTDDVDLTTLASGQQGNQTFTTDVDGTTPTSPTGGNGVTDDWDVLIEATADLSFANLTNAVNLASAYGAGDNVVNGKYRAPVVHDLFTAVATAGTDDVDFTTITALGVSGNVTFLTDVTAASVTSPTGGTGVTVAGDVLIGASADAAMLNFSRCVNKVGGTEAVNGDYLAAEGAAHPLLVATHDAGGDLVTFVTQTAGLIGNITITKDEASFTVTSPTGGSEDETINIEWNSDNVDIVALTWISSETSLDLVVPEDLVETAVEFDVYLQTSLDDGETWADIANFHFTGLDLTKIHAVVGTTALAANTTPTEGTIADNTILSGLIGDKLRVRYLTVSDIQDGEIVVNVSVH